MFKKILTYRKIISVLILLAVLIGISTFIKLPQRDIPEIDVNIATISTVYPGATPAEVERHITNILEKKLTTINGIEEVISTSASGFSSIVIEIEENENKDEVLAHIRQATSAVTSDLPAEALEPEISEAEMKSPIVSYFITSDNREALFKLQQTIEQWKEEVEAIPNVAGIVTKGLSDEEIIVQLQSKKLAENNLTPAIISQAIEEEFHPLPLGKQRKDDKVHQLSIDNYSNAEEMTEISIGKSQDGKPLYLKDVGTVEIRPKEMKDLITFQGKPAISFTPFVKNGADIPTVDQAVREQIESLGKTLPSNVKLEPYYSQANIVNETFAGLFQSLLISIIAVIITTTLGLTLSGAMIVVVAIPISLITGLIPLPFANVDLNQISVIGAIIALGILVDDSIVVNDNIQRRYRLGDDALTGAIKGTKEVWVSIVTSTLAIVFAFLPLVFLTGANGNFIRALPTVLITTIIASTIVALIFVPIMRYSLYKRSKQRISDHPGLLGKQLNQIANFYADKVLAKSVKRPRLFATLGLLFTTILLGLIMFIPFEFFPDADRKEVTIDVTLPIGTPLEATLKTLEEIESKLQEDQHVDETSVFAGTGLPNLFGSALTNSGEHTGQIVARIDKEKESANDFIDRNTAILRKAFPDAEIFLHTIQQGPPTGAPITVTITGPNLDRLLQIKDDLTKGIEDIGTEIVVDDIGSKEPTMKYVPDREKLVEYDISMKQISEQIAMRTQGLPLNSLDDGISSREVKLFIDEVKKDQEIDLSKITLSTGNTQKVKLPPIVRLDELIKVEQAEQLQRIPHLDGERSVTLRAYPGNVENFQKKVINFVDNYRGNLVNDDFSIQIGGVNKAQHDFFTEITILFMIVIFLVYLVIAFQFNSLSLPFLVLVAVYLAIAGAIVGLFITQTPISFLAVMGMVSLTGIVVRNAIVLIDFIEQALKKGMSLHDAVIESGRARIRPILLTALTTIVALISIAVSGDALFTPLAITIISGILFSTILTLMIVPTLYIIFWNIRHKPLNE